MIHNLLPVICGELNEHLKSIYGIDDDRVLVSNLMNQDGSVAVEGQNKVICFLANIEEETTLKANPGISSFGGSFGLSGGDIYVNLTVVFSAFFTGKNYVEALKFLSGVIYFFQSKSVFNPNNTPGLSSGIDKVVFDMTSLNFNDLNSLFSMIGAKYMPSVVYRVRMLKFTSDNIDGTIPSISGIGINDDSFLPEESAISGNADSVGKKLANRAKNLNPNDDLTDQQNILDDGSN